MVEDYWIVAAHAAKPETLGHPSLLWPSASSERIEAATVFGGATRPITLGYFVRARRDADRVVHYVRERDYRPGEAEAWYLTLTVGLDIEADREKLEPVEGGYLIDLLAGADDGSARSVKVRIDWDGDPDQTPKQVLESAREGLTVS
jgi:hypothetical protein